MRVLHISLFGKFNVQDECQNPIALDAHKLQELFSYLLLNQDRPHHRERLASLLWADNSTVQSKKYLRQALWQLRNTLDDNRKPENDLLVIDDEWVRFNQDASFQLDVDDFEAAYTYVQDTPGSLIDDSTAPILKDAISLYRGDLLEGWYQDWCLYPRERLQAMYLSMLHKLMGYCETHKEYQAGINYGQMVLHYDRAQERIHQQLMRLYYLSGDRSLALRQYQTCVAMLDEELGVLPSRQTEILYRQMQADQFDGVDDMREGTKAHLAASLWRLLDSLKQIRCELDSIQEQLEQHINGMSTTTTLD